MKRSYLLILPPMLAALAGGCQTDQFAAQPLGNVSYDEAFLAARNVLGQYFSIASADVETGKIVARPMLEGSPPRDRLLGTSPARRLAEMRVLRQDGQVIVQVRVDVQRQGRNAFREMEPVTVNNDLPYHPITEQTTPYTQEQLDAWESGGRDESMERKILADVVRAVHPAPVATAPAPPMPALEAAPATEPGT